MNEEAQARKKALRKDIIGGASIPKNHPVGIVDGDDAARTKVVSKKAQRRRTKKAEQRRHLEKHVAHTRQREDEEFLKIAERVSRINLEEGTVVKEDLECLESVQALDMALQKEQAKDAQPSKNNRRREACGDVGAAILQIGLWQASMKYGD